MFKQKKQTLSDKSIAQNPLRLWPGVVIVAVQWLIRFGIPKVVPEALGLGIFGGLAGGLAILVWWAFFSRAHRLERWGGVVLMIVALAVTSQLTDESIAKAQLGMTFFIYGVPVLSLAFVVWAVASRHLAVRTRRVTMVATILIACGAWTLIRTEGMTSDIGHEFSWRWADKPEELLLTRTGDDPMTGPLVQAATETGAHWPGFRGPDRDGIIHGVQIETGWSAIPPVELWRRPIGPGLSSFAVQGDLFYTQEQLGEDEVVACYNLNSGQPVWKHRDATRFLGADANPGPRATPTLSNGRLYTYGATGILNALNANDGALIWSRNAITDSDAKIPVWGLASSPLVVDNLVIIHVASTLIAYDIDTGYPRWSRKVGTGYSSPQLLNIDGVAQILMLSSTGATSFTPADGTLLWEYPWPSEDRILQPALTADGDILLSTVAKSIRRLSITYEPDGWSLEERWTSTRLKSNFNDLVIHKGHAYGFDGTSLACIDLEDGKRIWKGSRYGGQLLLLADQDLLLVLSEKGELALVEAAPGQFTELAQFTAIEGKTWNHPVLVGDILLVRNTQEMVAFRLSLMDS